MTRRALITGVGRQRGLGAAVARSLASEGWDLVLSHWPAYDERLGLSGSPEDTAVLAQELTELGARTETVVADLEDPTGPGALIDEAVAGGSGLDALVLSHCESVDSDLVTTTVESFDRHYAVNVRATWLLVAAFARQLPETGGAVVALTSDHTVGNLPYGATKAAADRVVLSAGHEFGHRGLRANVVNPGPIDTGWMDDDIRVALASRHPAGRLGTPEELADVVTFLLSDVGRWVNGQLIHSNGGFPTGRLPV